MSAHHPVHLVCGPAGSGKTLYGLGLARQRRAAFFDSDDCSEVLAQLVLLAHGIDPDDRDSPAYKRLLRGPVYETTYGLVARNCPQLPCVLVGPFTRESQRPEFPRELEQRFNAPVQVHFVWCDTEERRRRIAERGNPRDALKLRDWAGYLAASGEQRPVFEHLFVDTSSAVAPQGPTTGALSRGS